MQSKGFSLIDALMAMLLMTCGCFALLKFQWWTSKRHHTAQNYRHALYCLDSLSEWLWANGCQTPVPLASCGCTLPGIQVLQVDCDAGVLVVHYGDRGKQQLKRVM